MFTENYVLRLSTKSNSNPSNPQSLFVQVSCTEDNRKPLHVEHEHVWFTLNLHNTDVPDKPLQSWTVPRNNWGKGTHNGAPAILFIVQVSALEKKIGHVK